MAKPEWGTRYACFSCGCKFYDLNRREPLCPRCGIDQREAAQGARKPRPSRASKAPAEVETDTDTVDEPTEVEPDQEEILDEGKEQEEEEEEEKEP